MGPSRFAGNTSVLVPCAESHSSFAPCERRRARARGLELEVPMVHRERFLIEHRRTRLRAGDAHRPVAKARDETAKRGLPGAWILRDRHARRRRGVAGEDAAVAGRSIGGTRGNAYIAARNEGSSSSLTDSVFLARRETSALAPASSNGAIAPCAMRRRPLCIRSGCRASSARRRGRVPRSPRVAPTRPARRNALPWRARIPANRIDGSLADGRRTRQRPVSHMSQSVVSSAAPAQEAEGAGADGGSCGFGVPAP